MTTAYYSEIGESGNKGKDVFLDKELQRFSAVRYGYSIPSFKQTENSHMKEMVINPILFNVFINDLPNTWSTWVNSALFANNLVMWNSISKENQDGLNVILNRALKKVVYWCQENGMIVNQNKSKCQFFTLNR